MKTTEDTKKEFCCPDCGKEVPIRSFDKDTGKCKKCFNQEVSELINLIEEQFDGDEIIGFRD